jgi:hypothetical protein
MTAVPGYGPTSIGNSSVPLQASSTCWVPNSMALLNVVQALLDQRHRASSAIEGFNAAPLAPFSMCIRG